MDAPEPSGGTRGNNGDAIGGGNARGGGKRAREGLQEDGSEQRAGEVAGEGSYKVQEVTRQDYELDTVDFADFSDSWQPAPPKPGVRPAPPPPYTSQV